MLVTALALALASLTACTAAGGASSSGTSTIAPSGSSSATDAAVSDSTATGAGWTPKPACPDGAAVSGAVGTQLTADPANVAADPGCHYTGPILTVDAGVSTTALDTDLSTLPVFAFGVPRIKRVDALGAGAQVGAGASGCVLVAPLAAPEAGKATFRVDFSAAGNDSVPVGICDQLAPMIRLVATQ